MSTTSTIDMNISRMTHKANPIHTRIITIGLSTVIRIILMFTTATIMRASSDAGMKAFMTKTSDSLQACLSGSLL